MIQQINVEAEVNRARYMPQNSNIIACHNGAPDILLFDRSKHPLKAPKDGVCSPELRLKGHKKEGYGLAWNPLHEGQLVTGADDRLICFFDIHAPRARDGSVEPIAFLQGHSDVVEDVAFHTYQEHIFASGSDDRRIIIWDTRRGADKNTTTIPNAHDGEVNCIAFNPASEYLFASGSGDRTINIWDMRNLASRLHHLEAHSGPIFNVAWAPWNETILASCGGDRRVNIWDLSLIGAAQSPEDVDDGPPELLFIHGGHSEKVSDFSWNQNEEWIIASVSDNNILQIWQPAAPIARSE